MKELPFVDSFDSFAEKHPEISPDWREAMTPVIDDTEHQLYAFIMSYIFM